MQQSFFLVTKLFQKRHFELFSFILLDPCAHPQKIIIIFLVGDAFLHNIITIVMNVQIKGMFKQKTEAVIIVTNLEYF